MPILSYISTPDALSIAAALNNFTFDRVGGFRFSQADDANLDQLITRYAGDGASMQDIFDTALAAVSGLGTPVPAQYRYFHNNAGQMLRYIDSPIYDVSKLPNHNKAGLPGTRIGQRMKRDQILKAINFFSKFRDLFAGLQTEKLAYAVGRAYPGLNNKDICNFCFEGASSALEAYQNGKQQLDPILQQLMETQTDQNFLRSKEVLASFREFSHELNNGQSDLSKRINFQNKMLQVQGQTLGATFVPDYENLARFYFSDSNSKLEEFLELMTDNDCKAGFSSFLNGLDHTNFDTYKDKLEELNGTIAYHFAKRDTKGAVDGDKHEVKSNIDIPTMFKGVVLTSRYLFDDYSFDVLVPTFINCGMKVDASLKSDLEGTLRNYLGDTGYNFDSENIMSKGIFDPTVDIPLVATNIDYRNTERKVVNFLNQRAAFMIAHPPVTAPATAVGSAVPGTAAAVSDDEPDLQDQERNRELTQAQTVNWAAYTSSVVMSGLSLAVSAVTYPFRLAVSAVTYPFRLVAGSIKGLFKGKQASNNVDSSPEATPDSSPTARSAERAQTHERAARVTGTAHADRLTDRRTGQSTGAGRGQ